MYNEIRNHVSSRRCTCTGVENKKSIRFSQERPGITQHISWCDLLLIDMITMKYVIAIMHGIPKINDSKNAVRHLFISSLRHKTMVILTNSKVAHMHAIRNAIYILQTILTSDLNNFYFLYLGC
jgi:hypothetical protein